jgi:hypothetical protein
MLECCKNNGQVITPKGLKFSVTGRVVKLVSVIKGAQGNTWQNARGSVRS